MQKFPYSLWSYETDYVSLINKQLQKLQKIRMKNMYQLLRFCNYLIYYIKQQSTHINSLFGPNNVLCIMNTQNKAINA